MGSIAGVECGRFGWLMWRSRGGGARSGLRGRLGGWGGGWRRKRLRGRVGRGNRCFSLLLGGRVDVVITLVFDKNVGGKEYVLVEFDLFLLEYSLRAMTSMVDMRSERLCSSTALCAMQI